MFLTRFRHITILIGTLLLCLSAPLHAVVIYETDFMASPPNASTTTAKGEFTTTMPTWGTGYSSAYLTGGSTGACTITFNKALDLTKYKDVQITIDYGCGANNRTLQLSINGGVDNTLYTMTSSDRGTVIPASTSVSVTSISSLNVHSNGGNAYFFHLTIIGTPLTQENELKWSDGLADGATVNKFITDPSFTYTASATLSTGAITYSSSNPDVATVNATTGQVTLVGTGDAVITATQEAQGTYPEISITYNLHVTELTNILTWSGGLTDGASVTKSLSDGSVTYTASANLSTAAITYSSSDPTVATVDANGKVTFLKAGSTTITATQAATPMYESTSVTYNLTITAQDCSGKSISWSTTSKTLKLPGESYKYNGKIYTIPGVYLDTTERYDGGCPKKIYIITINADTTATICEGGIFYWDRTGKTYNAKGTYETISTDVEVPGKGTYTFTVRLKIAVSGKATSSLTRATITRGSSYTWFGKEYTQQGTYEDIDINAVGCDSLGTLMLGVCGNVPDTGYVVAVINQGEAFYWRYTNTSYRVSTRDTANFHTIYGCDSVAILDLTVQNVPAGHLAKTICEGDVYDWHGMKLTEAGVYTYGSEVLHLGVLPNPNIEACEDKIIQHGVETSVKLFVTGADYYKWKPKESLSSEWDTEPIASPIVTTDYIARSYNSAGANTVINGDFEMGPDAAASGKSGDPNLPAGAIASYYTHLWYTRKERTFGTHIITQKSGELFGKSIATPDHTKGDGTGYMMVIDGFNRSETPQDSIMWQQEVDVIPNTDYIFSAYFMTVLKGSTAKLQFCVNGVPLGDVREAPTATDTWLRYYELWACDSTTTRATLTITNLNPDGQGNDFALDDISFQALGPCFGLDTVRVIINFDIHLFPSCTHIIDERQPNEVPEMTDRTVTFSVDKYCADQYGTYLYGDQLTVYAHDEECRVFSQWSDGNTDNPRIFTVGEDDFTINAIYVGEPFTITTKKEGEGTVTGGQEYWCKDTATITATPDPCWQFIQWKEDGNTDPVRVLEVTKEHTFTAIFQKIPYVITVRTKDGTTTKGSVTGQVNNE